MENSKVSERNWKGEWKQVEDKKPSLQISVHSPEVSGSMMSKHINYTVQSEPLKFSVKRRFNDFVWLRDILVSRYHALLIPSLPMTTSFNVTSTVISGKTDVNGSFVQNRMFQLNLFMRELCKIPFLLNDKCLEAFISLHDEKEFKVYVESSAKLTIAVTADYDQYKVTVVESMLLSGDIEKSITEVRRQLDVLKTTLKAMESQYLLVAQHAISYSKEIQTLFSNVVTWNAVESDLCDSTKTDMVNAYGADIKNQLSVLLGGNHIWIQTTQDLPKVIANTILSNISFQMAQIEGFRDFFSGRDNLVRDLGTDLFYQLILI